MQGSVSPILPFAALAGILALVAIVVPFLTPDPPGSHALLLFLGTLAA
jgi:hypothetical protein